ncbi:2Fe-2S iron-sulfur cluster-binding protein [Aquibaculum arenosum]|uniref:2Fe-2S iron-sulfur cluster-binding protein n=1 Tax=Aquibaculum arenosum TaxID=3032591 RepID=A0ABT5YJF4_9PROT|nr:2Fe-2S iron-sulfur cluster-binding protein [Fodinicurvata sp. CAU 1616]MDF2095047.1 2Fe-2S iron-sulfur cluster-binding protein [Fodinicurvata sp. CAU 1616]
MTAASQSKQHTTSTDALTFTFDGRALVGRHGDTVASALLANGVFTIGRSFKYHRPRGFWSAGAEEPNGLFDIRHQGRHHPNARGTLVPLEAGMEVRSVNTSPSAAQDRLSLLDRLGRFLPAGFYYKTFLWPDWHLYEPRIRAMAGLGRLDPAFEPPGNSPQRSLHCDLLIIGAGPAGLAAAHAAATAGRRVLLVELQRQAGGSLLHRPARIEGLDGTDWVAATLNKLSDQGGELLTSTTAYGIYDHNLVCLWEQRQGRPDRLWRVRPREIVLATGASERPLVFENNDRPGILSADAGLHYLRRHGVRLGERVVIATNNDSVWPVATGLRDAGARVTIADSRAQASLPAPEGVELLTSAPVTSVQGRKRAEAVIVKGRSLAADLVLVSGGFTPNVHLYCQARGRLHYDEERLAFRPGQAVPGLQVVGAANGTFLLADALKEGHRSAGSKEDVPRAEAALEQFSIEAAWPDTKLAGRQWIDFQNDVTLKDVALAAQENFRSVEHLKRYTTLGMATDQGKTSNMNGLAAMAAVTGRTIPEVGTTTFRPPYVPVPFTVIAGRRRGELFSPVRRLVLENAHRQAGAAFREYGSWLRPAFYGVGTPEEAIHREARQARQSVGLFDGSPLGKIEVMGPQAAALLDFNSYNRLSTLKPGRIRYGFMLTESGVVYDDGVVLRVSEDHFIVSCSSGHVPGVVMRLEEWRQDRFDPSQVVVHNSTAQWSTLTATGPQARSLVAALDLGVDLGDDALPHMAFAQGRFRQWPVRVARVSFTGDRSYELSLPAAGALTLWQRMLVEGQKREATLLGSEALMILRAEKGYIVAGKDTDGYTMPMDLGLSGPREKRQDEYVGKRALFTPEATKPNRPALVGLEVEGSEPLPTGAHAIERSGTGQRSLGFVTSSYWSPMLGRPIALALVEAGRARLQQEIEIYHLGQQRRARVVAPCAFDPEGARLNA